MDFPSLLLGLALGAVIGAALWALLRAGPRLSTLSIQLAQLEALRTAEATAGSAASQALQTAAAQAFAQGQQQLLQLTEAKLKETQATAKTDLTALLTPLSANLEALTLHNRALEQSRITAHADLNQQIVSLLGRTEQLNNALSRPQGRGRWGEVQLQRLLELSGMESYADYSLQTSYRAEEESGQQRLRPDCVISLPGGKKVIVDVKTPLDAYFEVERATDLAAQKIALGRHAQQLRTHMLALADKKYRAQEPSAEFVVLFVPGEHLVSAALQEDPQLFDDGLARGVIIASTATLMMLLKAYAFGWRQETVVDTANRTIEAGRMLHDRLRTMVDHFQRVGGGLATAMKSFNAAVGSYESRVLPQARKFAELGVIETARGDEVALETVEDVAPRSLSGSAEITPLKLTGND